MVRSIFLRGFDQDMANRIGTFMENHKTKFIRSATPSKLEKLDGEDG
jgi:thioredoxin reductase (NADPH)